MTFELEAIEGYKRLIRTIFDKLCTLDKGELKYLSERMEKAKEEGKDGLEWTYDALPKVLQHLNKTCFRSILFGFKGSKQTQHHELPLHELMVATKIGKLPNNQSFMLEALNESKVLQQLKNHFSELEMMVYPGESEEGLSSIRVALYIKEKASVEPLWLEGQANMEVLKTA